MLDQSVIQRCAEVLHLTEDGNRLTARELSEIQFLSNNYHRLSEKGKSAALDALDNMLRCRNLLKEVT